MGNRKKVLVVDDTSSILLIYSDVLRNAGYEVFTASSGEMCLKIAKSEVPNLILLDVMMPEMDGGMVAHHLRKNSVTSNIPIIFMTSLLSEGEANSSKKPDEEMHYLSKSSPYSEIVKKVKEVIG